MRKLKQKLSSWVTAGLLSTHQANAILAYEEKTSGERSWAVFGIAGVGLIALACGIISVIAANWAHIPATVKIGAQLLVLAGLTIGAYRTLASTGLLREALLAFLSLWLLAGIALIGQHYNLRGEAWQTFLFWNVLTLPLALIARNRLNAHLWFISLAIAGAIWIGGESFSRVEGRLFTAAAVPFMLFAVGAAGAGILPETFRGRALTWSILALSGFSIIAQILWYDGGSRELNLRWMMPAAALAIAAVVYRFRKENRLLAFWLSLTLLALTASFVLPVTAFQNAIHLQSIPAKLTGTFLFMLTWFAAAAAAATAGKRRLFDFCTAVIALRFMAVYFELFGSLAATGAGLILSGVIILVLAFVWNKQRVAVAARLKVQR